MLSFTECILIAIQVALWVCRCPKELPEVPSCRHRNFFAEEDEDSSCDESSVEGDAATSVSREAAGGYGGKAEEGFDSLWAGTGTGSVISPIRIPPKNFDNSIHEKVLNRREVRATMPSSLELYDRKQQLENVEPIAAHTTDYGSHVTHE
ncbi:hypothetical protein AAVH_31945 [Aphelenchoides avenae]|nr:hypothetical protein AAVH_31945 [Aphelenchus avenae]